MITISKELSSSKSGLIMVESADIHSFYQEFNYIKKFLEHSNDVRNYKISHDTACEFHLPLYAEFYIYLIGDSSTPWLNFSNNFKSNIELICKAITYYVNMQNIL